VHVGVWRDAFVLRRTSSDRPVEVKELASPWVGERDLAAAEKARTSREVLLKKV
jgi:hypothetical protein